MDAIFGRRAARGRRFSVAKERFWREHLARQATGGISVRGYCRRHALAEPSFYAWRRELAKRDRDRLGGPAPSATPRGSVAANSLARGTARKPQAVGFVRLDVPAEAIHPPTIEIVLPGDVRVRVPAGAAGSHLREVLAALGIDAKNNSDAEATPC